jgi:hypothetical protein
MNWTSRHHYFLSSSLTPVQEAAAPVWTDDRPWLGDEAHVEAINGGVRLAYSDEEGLAPDESGVRGAARALLNALVMRMIGIVARPGGAAAMSRRGSLVSRS